MTTIDVSDSTVVIIGGDSGIGLLIARHLVRAGTQRIGLISRDADAGSAAAKSVFELASGIWSLSAAGDLSSESEASRMLSELSGSLGDPDIVVNCLRADGGVVSDLVLQTMQKYSSGVFIDLVATESQRRNDAHRVSVIDDSADPDGTAESVVAAVSVHAG
ncbi:SDR family oxidoreductase [Rhodococcoides fascians A25f]|uniref:SDR family NAD(P)-dependent oxidoreductase n=1 Tax=Rhodococcoides fascians TaxID=1828 RepID=UPI0009B8966D|nr:SDR family oxidoreductase [Rhodococcus fascians]QII07828.1 SDR family oxidoreductase [Rhodococcus fascians A25f]